MSSESELQAMADRFKITPVLPAQPVRPFPRDVEQAEEVYHETKRAAEGEFHAMLTRSGTAALGR